MAEFALDLDHAAIALLRRERDRGWETLGRAPLDAPDLDARLRALREKAAALSGGRAAVRLLIPDSQILHLDFETDPEWDALDDEARHEVVVEVIEARTAQPVEELAFDWREEEGWVRAAVVAADTLRDAAAFAAAYGFAPTGFGAWPDPGAFPEEADFGPTDEAHEEAEAPAAVQPQTGAEAAPAWGAPKGERLAGALAYALHQREAGEAPEAPRRDAPRPAAPAPFGGPAPSAAAKRSPRRALIAGAVAGLVALASALALTLGPGAEEPQAAVEPSPIEPEVASAPEESPPPEPRPFAAEPVVVPVPASDAPTRQAEALPAPEEAEGEVRSAEVPETLADPAPQDAAVADPALASYAATGIWQAAPEPIAAPRAQEVAAPAPAAADAPETAVAPLLVPPADRAGDAAPAAVAPPPAPDTDLPLVVEEDVEPTPEGTVTPDGITLYAAAPPRRPPAKPEETPTQTIAAPGGTSAFQDPALAGFRPRARPADTARLAAATAEPTAATEESPAEATDPAAGDPAELEPEPPAEEAEPDDPAERVAVAVADARAAAPALSLLPVSPTDPAPRAAAVDAAVAASLFRAPETLPEVTLADPPVTDEGTASAFAVAGSLRPVVRPEEVAEAIAEARAAAAAAPPSEQGAPTVAPAAAPTVAAAAPQLEIPTQASVARRATVDSALAMNRLSLVGVFGAEGARRALVRLPSGRFEKVQVGDRIDGGRVHSIDGGRLIYVRRGRAVALEMPRG